MHLQTRQHTLQEKEQPIEQSAGTVTLQSVGQRTTIIEVAALRLQSEECGASAAAEDAEKNTPAATTGSGIAVATISAAVPEADVAAAAQRAARMNTCGGGEGEEAAAADSTGAAAAGIGGVVADDVEPGSMTAAEAVFLRRVMSTDDPSDQEEHIANDRQNHD